MDQRKKRIIELIKTGVEGENVDFKRQYYHDAKKSDFIKDIISLANASSLDDKFIIFGVSDETRDIVGISEGEIPDISDINQLIRSYCDPFVEIDIEQMDVDAKKVAAIVIKKTNMRKPYVVAKDFSYKAKICLHAGDIYIRKSANNFRALRSDIEDIYKSRLFVEVAYINKKIKIGTIEIAKTKQKYARVSVSLSNSTENTFIFNKAAIKWTYPDSEAGSSVLYMDEDRTQFKESLNSIEKVPFVLSPKSQAQKTLYVNVSDGFCQVIKKQENMQQDLRVEIILCDARGEEFKTSFVVDTILWE